MMTIKNILWIIALLAITSFKSDSERKQNNSETVIKNDFIANETKHFVISVNSESLDLIIDSSGTDKIKVIKDFNEKEISYKETVTDDEIDIVCKSKKSIITDGGKIEIQVPKNAIINCNLMNGNAMANKISCQSINIISMSGDIKVRNVTAISANYNSMSGSISYKGKVDNGKTVLNSMSGDINIILNGESNVKLELLSEKSTVLIDDELAKKNSVTKTIKEGTGYLSGHSITGSIDCTTK